MYIASISVSYSPRGDGKLESVFPLSHFHGVTADANISDLTAMLFGTSLYVTGTLHLYALLNMQGLAGFLQSIVYQP